MSGGFRFDFSTTARAGDESSSASSSDGAQSRSIANANELVARLMERCERNAIACTPVDASSEALSSSVDDDKISKVTGGDESETSLPSPLHESIDLSSGGMDRLLYVMPKQTISNDTTDLIPGVYEGGLKVWECSVDLCRFLARAIYDLSMEESSSENRDDRSPLLAALESSLGMDGSTMEIGCGHGLPGCLILRENTRRILDQGKVEEYSNSVIVFADFNDFVLHHATIPNAQLNCRLLRGDAVAMDEARKAKFLAERSIFVGGDWMGLSHKLSSNDLLPSVTKRMDLILASETTYTPESCQDTAFLILRHLKIDVGVALVATKRFYFGVGGGTDLFTAACEMLSLSDRGPFSGLRLCTRVVQSCDAGNANIRDLLEVRCKRR